MPAICQVLYYAFKWLHSFNPHNKPRRLVVLLAPGDKSEKGGTECPGHTSVSGKTGLPHRQPQLLPPTASLKVTENILCTR